MFARISQKIKKFEIIMEIFTSCHRLVGGTYLKLIEIGTVEITVVAGSLRPISMSPHFITSKNIIDLFSFQSRS